MGEQDIHKIPEIFIEEEIRELDKTNGEVNLIPEEKAFVEKIHFGQGEKSSADYINAYNAISIYSQLGNFEKMKVVKTYKEYFENSPYVLELSDKETVKKIDELVSEFNSDLDRIKEEKDIEAVKDFLDKIGNLMKEKK